MNSPLDDVIPKMSYAVFHHNGAQFYMKLEDAFEGSQLTGGTVFVNYDLYLQEVDPNYKMSLWAEYLWKKFRKWISSR